MKPPTLLELPPGPIDPLSAEIHELLRRLPPGDERVLRLLQAYHKCGLAAAKGAGSVQVKRQEIESLRRCLHDRLLELVEAAPTTPAAEGGGI